MRAIEKCNHKHESGHHHHHDISHMSGKKIGFVTLFNLIITIAEIIGGMVSGSIALLSDAMHNLSDTISIMISYFANKISQKKITAKKSYGYKRAEILAAFVNSLGLILISVYLIFAAIRRFNNPEEINSNLMMIVAIVGLFGNLFSVFLLVNDSKHNINLKAAYLHLLGDTVSSIGVVLGALLIKYFKIIWVDPILTILISIYIIKEAYHIFKKSVDILMQSSAPLDYENIKKDIENINKIKNIHHVHTWMSNENTFYFEAHIELEDMMISDTKIILEQIHNVLKEKYSISHITIQFEVDKCLW